MKSYFQLVLLFIACFIGFNSCLCADQKQKVIVVGAGISGITAAKALVDQGFSVQILEARNRIGGRIWTNDDLGMPLDLGASWIHGVTGNPITDLVDQQGIVRTLTDYGSTATYNTKARQVPQRKLLQANRRFNSIFRQALRSRQTLTQDRSLGFAINPLIRMLRAKQRELVRLIANSNLVVENGADLRQLSLLFYNQDQAFSGADYLFPSGYVQLINALSTGLNISTGEVVSAVTYSTSGVTITTQTQSYTADYLVMTVPLGVLKAGSIQFNPSLPATKLRSIRGLNMGTLNKIALKFPNQFWSPNVDFIGNAKKREVGEFLNWNHYVPDSNILIGLTGGAIARRLEQVSTDELTANVMQTLRRIYGDSIPEPEKVIVTKWKTDPFAFGSYSHIPVNGKAKYYDILAQPLSDENNTTRVFFAGEHTNRQYPSTVHGAYLSGLRAANEILNLGS